ncbi:FeoB-associated Cys-rich membrane protein [Desulfovibrio sp. TomC]|uniref:FeoB-associated Cys-rich membrane protein n=1 Tax=Desulfovibrio sp. TomC TaxID=1562888 RepID=UPI000574870B|nr:FeoB-associated Cys-rich membrane protein [Desulfovibrio sp. TomC]KHK00559.1 hypothetical protein NY78_4027 [Desulfovibrio sp. TomC]
MDTLIVAVIVAAAAWYVFRKFFGKKAGACGCGCSGGSCGNGTRPQPGGSCCEPGRRL